MRNVVLGKTGISVPQNAFGALPLQRVPVGEAVCLLRKAYDGGMRLFDTARNYTDSEEKLGLAFHDIRENLVITTKTAARTPEGFWKDLETSLKKLKTDYIDVYQLHNVPQCYKPGDGSGLYECLLEAKEKGLVRHIGITTHLIAVAEEIIASGLYETLQFPFSYLSDEREIAMVRSAVDAGMGFLCMKALAGGLINDYRCAYAFISQFPGIVPIWGIQKETELDEWLSLFEREYGMDEEISGIIEKDREELAGEFCRGCGYCAPCTVGIEVNLCARMSLMVRRAVIGTWLDETNQALMARIPDCIECGVCRSRCPYGLDIPKLLKKNYEDYQAILRDRAGALTGGRAWL